MEIESHEPRPLLLGRISRVALGVAVLAAALLTELRELSLLAFVALLVLGVCFVLGGLLPVPGCELAALPNLLLPKRYRFSFR